MTIKSDLKECKKIWESFSPGQSLFDLWDFRVAFYEGYGFAPHFLTLQNKSSVSVCVPLWFNEEKKKYEWFGGDWHEDNTFFYKDPKDFPILLESIPAPCILIGIIPDKFPTKFGKVFKKDLPQYVKSIKNLTFDEILASFTKKHRYNLRYDYRKISNNNPTVEFITESRKQLKLLEKLKKMSLKRFHGLGGRLISCFSDKHEFESFKSIMKNQGKYKVRGVLTKIDGNLAAIDFTIVYNKKYYLLTGANDLVRYPGIGNFMNYLEFKDAVELGAHEVNAMQEDHNWKHKYFEEKPLLKLEYEISH